MLFYKEIDDQKSLPSLNSSDVDESSFDKSSEISEKD